MGSAAKGLEQVRALTSRVPRRLAVVLALSVLFVAARCLYLEVDPPRALDKIPLRELLVEPIAKASEARNQALFGRWTPNPADEYQFWRPQSPAWVYPLAAFLSAFGVGLAQLRVFATLYSLAGFVVLLAIARQKLRGIELVSAGLFVAADVLYVAYSRSGMLEPAVNTWAAVMVLCLLLARRHWAWLLPAQYAFVVAFFTKGAALYLLPLLVGASAWLIWRSPGATDQRRARAVVLLNVAALTAAVIAYVRSDFYLRTLIHNFNHMVLQEHGSSTMLVDSVKLETLLSSITNPEKLRRYSNFLPVTGPLALFEIGAVAWCLIRRRPVDSWRVIVGAWFLCALVALLPIKAVEMRFGSILPMPAAVVAASGIRTLVRRFSRRGTALRLALSLAPLLAFGLVNLEMYETFYAKRSREVVAASRLLSETIGQQRAAIIGYSSAPVVFSTPYEHYYVKEPFNVSRATLDKLEITHLLLSKDRTTRDETRQILNKRYPGALKELPVLMRTRVYTAELMLYAVPGSLARAEQDAR